MFIVKDRIDYQEYGSFKTRKEAKAQIKELKEFDKEEGNPFDEDYFIEDTSKIKTYIVIWLGRKVWEFQSFKEALAFYKENLPTIPCDEGLHPLLLECEVDSQITKTYYRNGRRTY